MTIKARITAALHPKPPRPTRPLVIHEYTCHPPLNPPSHNMAAHKVR